MSERDYAPLTNREVYRRGSGARNAFHWGQRTVPETLSLPVLFD